MELIIQLREIFNVGAQLPANSDLIGATWPADDIAVILVKSEAMIPPLSWLHWALGNYDKKWLITRIGKEQAKVAAMLVLNLKRTPSLYYGDESGCRMYAFL